MASPKKKKTPKASKKPARKASKPKKKKASAHAKKRTVAAKKPARVAKKAKKAATKKSTTKSLKHAPVRKAAVNSNSAIDLIAKNHRPRKLDAFTKGQREKLLQLRDAMVDSMAGVAQDTLRSRAEGSEASAFGMHQADAGSDAYDRDFALSLLSQEQDALYEIDQALKRIELGTYGICEMSGKAIPHARLEAIPFARFTVQCQAQLEKQNKASRVRQSVTSLFGLTDEEGGEGEEEEAAPTADANKE
jgi:DnaK suppressor protein